MKDHKHLFQSLRAGDETVFRAAYHHFRPAFLRWAKSRGLAGEPDLLDLYQDAMVILFQNLQEGRIEHLDNGLMPYLIGISKNLIRARRLKNWRELPMDPEDEIFAQQLHLQPEPDEKHSDELAAHFAKALAEMSQNCLKIIEMFYYRGYSIDVIRERLGYSSDEVTRVTKMRCLRKLRDIFEQNPT